MSYCGPNAIGGEMGLGAWLKRIFGGHRPHSEMVQYLDVASGRVVQIPAAELRAGAIEVRMQGIEGSVWVLADQLKPGEVRHPPFNEEIRAYIRKIQDAFAEHRPLSFDEWEIGFRRDANPEPEIALWSHAADVYSSFADNEPSSERREDLYRVVVTCLAASPDTVWRVLELAMLTRTEAEQVIRSFYGRYNE